MYDSGTHKVRWRLCFDYQNLENLKNFAIKVCDGDDLPMWCTAQKSPKCKLTRSGDKELLTLKGQSIMKWQ